MTRAGSDIEGSKQRRRAVTSVVMSAPFDLARADRQQRLASIQGLDLGFLTHALHECPLWWRQLEPNDVSDLLHEQRVV